MGLIPGGGTKIPRAACGSQERNTEGGREEERKRNLTVKDIFETFSRK